MVCDRKVLSFVANRAQMFHETVSETMLGFTDVEGAILGTTDTVDQVDRCAGEPLSDVESLFCALNGGERGVTRDGDGEVQEGVGVIRDGSGEFEVGVEGVSKIDELFKLLVGAGGSIDTVIEVMVEEVGNQASVAAEEGLFHVSYKGAGIAWTQ
eukprot:g32600.t1